LTLLLTYSTEANLFIPNLYQSPFNVGTEVLVRDFTSEQVEELHARYGHPLPDTDAQKRLYDLVGGHPYLVRRSLHEIKTRGLAIAALEIEAQQEDGPFSDHLERIRLALHKDGELLAVVRGMLRGEASPTRESLSRLRAAGVVLGASPEEAQFRCRLYERYLSNDFYKYTTPGKIQHPTPFIHYLNTQHLSKSVLERDQPLRRQHSKRP
jgi:hypothetical protein